MPVRRPDRHTGSRHADRLARPTTPPEGNRMSTNHLPAAPGALLGYRSNGTPIRLIAGGSGDEPPAADPNTNPPATEPPATEQGGHTDPEPTAPAPPDPASSQQPSDTPDTTKTERTIAAIREDFKAERAKRQAAEKEMAALKTALEADKAERAKQMDALAIALGIKNADEPPDPAKLAEELKAARDQAQADITQRDSTLRQQAVELAVLRNAAKHGAVGDALLDSRAFMAKVSSLDPGADDFAEQLGDAIKTAVETGPQYKAAAAGAPKAAPAPPRSGGEFNGSPGGNRQWTLADVEAHTAAEVVAAQDAGLLVDLGYAPRKRSR